MDELSLFLPNFNVFLVTDYVIDDKRDIKGIKHMEVVQDSVVLFMIFIDERTNVMRTINKDKLSNFNLDIYLYLEGEFEKLKKSNPNYGNIGMGDEYDYDPTNSIFINDFIQFLRNEGRDNSINKILDVSKSEN